MQDNKVIQNVLKMVESQQNKGFSKYGEYVTPDHLDVTEWVHHLQEELCDALIYLECIKQKLTLVQKQ